MKKKIIIVLVLVLTLTATWFGFEIYKYYNPECGFKIGAPLDKNSDVYIENLTYYINERSVFGANRDIYDKSAKILDGAYELQSKILEDYSANFALTV